MIAARQIAFGKAAGKKPYDAEIEFLESVKSSIAMQIELPTMEWTHFECEMSISESADRKYIGLPATRDPSFVGNSRGYGVVCTYGGYYRGGTSFMGFASNTYTPELNKKVYYKSPSPSDSTWIIDGENISVGSTERKKSPCYLFHPQDKTQTFDFAPSKIWWVKIYDGDILLYDLIPVRVGTVGYMYDKVSGKLFGNAGAGEFVLGADI